MTEGRWGLGGWGEVSCCCVLGCVVGVGGWGGGGVVPLRGFRGTYGVAGAHTASLRKRGARGCVCRRLAQHIGNTVRSLLIVLEALICQGSAGNQVGISLGMPLFLACLSHEGHGACC